MTVAEVNARIAQITPLVGYEHAQDMADELFKDVLHAIASGCGDNPSLLAEAALQVLKL